MLQVQGKEIEGNSVQFGCIVVDVLVHIYGSVGGGHVIVSKWVCLVVMLELEEAVRQGRFGKPSML